MKSVSFILFTFVLGSFVSVVTSCSSYETCAMDMAGLDTSAYGLIRYIDAKDDFVFSCHAVDMLSEVNTCVVSKRTHFGNWTLLQVMDDLSYSNIKSSLDGTMLVLTGDDLAGEDAITQIFLYDVIQDLFVFEHNIVETGLASSGIGVNLVISPTRTKIAVSDKQREVVILYSCAGDWSTSVVERIEYTPNDVTHVHFGLDVGLSDQVLVISAYNDTEELLYFYKPTLLVASIVRDEITGPVSLRNFDDMRTRIVVSNGRVYVGAPEVDNGQIKVYNFDETAIYDTTLLPDSSLLENVNEFGAPLYLRPTLSYDGAITNYMDEIMIGYSESRYVLISYHVLHRELFNSQYAMRGHYTINSVIDVTTSHTMITANDILVLVDGSDLYSINRRPCESHALCMEGSTCVNAHYGLHGCVADAGETIMMSLYETTEGMPFPVYASWSGNRVLIIHLTIFYGPGMYYELRDYNPDTYELTYRQGIDQYNLPGTRCPMSNADFDPERLVFITSPENVYDLEHSLEVWEYDEFTGQYVANSLFLLPEGPEKLGANVALTGDNVYVHLYSLNIVFHYKPLTPQDWTSFSVAEVHPFNFLANSDDIGGLEVSFLFVNLALENVLVVATYPYIDMDHYGLHVVDANTLEELWVVSGYSNYDVLAEFVPPYLAVDCGSGGDCLIIATTGPGSPNITTIRILNKTESGTYEETAQHSMITKVGIVSLFCSISEQLLMVTMSHGSWEYDDAIAVVFDISSGQFDVVHRYFVESFANRSAILLAGFNENVALVFDVVESLEETPGNFWHFGVTNTFIAPRNQLLCMSNPCQYNAACVEGPGASYDCKCPEGKLCIDHCASNPCARDTNCTALYDTYNYVCDCGKSGFYGLQCEIDIDDCESSPCSNNGICSDTGAHSYACNCSGTGYEGLQCETEVDDCLSSPCANDGVCADLGIHAYACDCHNTGFDGIHCTVDVDDCLSSPCMHDGNCTDIGIHAFECACPYMFMGSLCHEDAVSPCVSSPCRESGSCTWNGDSMYECACIHGLEGLNCELDQDDCVSSPCKFGQCEDIGLNEFQCECQDGYIGTFCDAELDREDLYMISLLYGSINLTATDAEGVKIEVINQLTAVTGVDAEQFDLEVIEEEDSETGEITYIINVYISGTDVVNATEVAERIESSSQFDVRVDNASEEPATNESDESDDGAIVIVIVVCALVLILAVGGMWSYFHMHSGKTRFVNADGQSFKMPV